MIEVNLHPAGPKARRKGRRKGLAVPGWLKAGLGDRDPWLMGAIAVPVVVLLAIGALLLSQRAQRGGLESRLELAVEDSVRLSDLRALSDSLLAREAMIRARLEQVQGLDDNRFVWSHLLDEISRALPQYTWLTALRETSALPELRVQIDGLAANPLAITAFVRNLQASPYIAEVRIVGSQQQQLEQVIAQAFRLAIQYTAPPDSLVRRRPVAVREGA